MTYYQSIIAIECLLLYAAVLLVYLSVYMYYSNVCVGTGFLQQA